MDNKYPQITFVFDRRKIACPTIKSSVDMRICYNYKQRFIATGLKLYANQWKDGKIVNCPDIMQISQTLNKMLTDVRQIILEMGQKGSIDIFAVPDKFKERNNPKTNFIDFCNQRATIRKYGKKADSQERYNRFIRLFTAWGGIREFEDINDKSIISYDKYLNSTGMKHAKWIADHPDKKVLNVSLGRYICVKFLSINETYEKAARSYESTIAVFRLTEILNNATLVDELPAKRNTRNQKQFEKLLVMRYENIKLTVGLQRSNQDLVQYCITVPQILPLQNKAINSEG